MKPLTKMGQKEQGNSLHIDKSNNPAGGCNNSKI
jgi:hypothetical protein